MMRMALVALIPTMLLLSVACGGNDGPDSPSLADSGSMAASSQPATVHETPVTGNAQVDGAIGEILREDVDALMRRVQITQRPCAEGSGTNSTPDCPPGTTPGTLVDAMYVAGCESEYRTSEAEVRSMLELRAFRYSGNQSIFAVLRGSLDDATRGGFVVALDVQDEMVSGATGQLWGFDEDGRLVAMALGCGHMPARDMLHGFFTSPDYVVSPAA